MSEAGLLNEASEAFAFGLCRILLARFDETLVVVPRDV